MYHCSSLFINMSCRIYMGRLPYGTREEHVRKFFRSYGRLREINLKNGYGFVEFEDPRDADDAVFDCNGKELLGERILVEHSRGTSKGYSSTKHSRARDKYGPPTRTPWRMLVENLSSRVSWQDLKDYARQVGDVAYGDAHKPRQGEGIIEFHSKRDLKRAVRKLDGRELCGKRIKIIDESPRSRSRSRSVSRSRSRSRSNHHRRRHSSRSRSRSRSHSSRKSRSRSPFKDRGRSKSDSPKQSASRSPSRSKTRSLSKSPTNEEMNDKQD
ncbi:serine/arginine-rich splicing factor 6 [Exaiptasia diaphana]|uniref:RRM domain-containing protein n=1 Tax=Exaiptasia diaphana TaxID=2652724 RepID=A0A913WTM7_EXADI|nr:serine/arginine-rich splicing factor 6 [Exaiptasia diaphana]KXJ17986.1 Serine/arginine-rich splicing factor 4 [Exaiptasia diaphana]